MATRKTRRPKRGSPRVAAWIHEVINPLLEALPVEISFLESGNTTWRYYSRRPEYLRPVEGYLAPQARFILRDFVQANADAKKHLANHDKLLEGLIVTVTQAHTALMNRDDFVDHARKRLAEFTTASSDVEYPGGAIPKEDFPNLVAERVVNAIGDVLSHYSDAKFWERYRTEFLDFGRGTEFERLQAGRNALLKHDRMLHEWLGKKSFRLCEEYDVPAARFPGWSRTPRTVGSA